MMQEVARGQPNGLAAFDNGADNVGGQEGITDCLAHAVRWDGVFGGNLLIGFACFDSVEPGESVSDIAQECAVDGSPSSLSRVFLRRVLLHERQCRTHGGLSAATRRALAAMANGTPGNAALAGSVSAGTHLVREWNGRTYQVEVIDNGYRFDGKTYPSLTAITKRITGTHWSGPRFFGLTPKRKA